MDSDDLWRSFQSAFLVKLHSADFKQTFEDRRNTLTSLTPASVLTSKTGSSGKVKGRTLQRRRSKTGEEIRGQIEKAAMPSPVPVSPRGDNGGKEGEGFFMTEYTKTFPSTSPTQSPRNGLASSIIPLSSLPPPTESDILALTKKSNLLRNRVETVIHQASAELRKPIPGKYQALKTLMEKLEHSKEERKAFYRNIEAIMKRRNENCDFNVIKNNRQMVSDGSLTRDFVLKKREVMFKDREEKIEKAKDKVKEMLGERLRAVEAKVKRRDIMREEENIRLERASRAREWIKVLTLAKYVSRVRPLYGKIKEEKKLASKETQLANKIIGLWAAKKAPSKGKKYRECVKKLRGFIKSKTASWKLAQKQRACDLMILFLQEHRRANLPIVVRHFIGGVKTWQRWYRNYRKATEGRIKGMLMVWEEVEGRWFEKEEQRLRDEANEKKRMEEEFDLDKVLGSMGGRIQRGPKYARAKGEKRDDIAPLESLRRGSSRSPSPSRTPAKGGKSVFDPLNHRSTSPTVSPTSGKVRAQPPQKSPRFGSTPRGAGNGPGMASPNARRRMNKTKTPSTPASSSSPQRNKSKKRGMNHSQTSVIIDMRLQKDLLHLRTLKPSLSVKRQLLRQKLMELRLRYKVSSKEVKDMMQEGKEGEVKKKDLNIEDALNLITTPLLPYVPPPTPHPLSIKSMRRRSRVPCSSNRINLFTMMREVGMVEGWVKEAKGVMEDVIRRREERIIGEAKRGSGGRGIVGMEREGEENGSEEEDEEEEGEEGEEGGMNIRRGSTIIERRLSSERRSSRISGSSSRRKMSGLGVEGSSVGVSGGVGEVAVCEDVEVEVGDGGGGKRVNKRDGGGRTNEGKGGSEGDSEDDGKDDRNVWGWRGARGRRGKRDGLTSTVLAMQINLLQQQQQQQQEEEGQGDQIAQVGQVLGR